MAYSSKAVANLFLDLGKRDKEPISPMKLQKLIYFAQGWHLGLADDSLIDEQVECWKYGPVIDSLFHEFKQYGGSEITRPAMKRKLLKNGEVVRSVPRIPEDAFKDREFVEEMWRAYGNYSAVKLSNMTHETNGPWHRVFTQWGGNPPKGTDIPREYMKEYFKALAVEGV